MRTKESEEFQEQENTWIYLLHQRAPPQTRETSVAALAQAAGAPPTLPPATALFGGSSALFPSHDDGPYLSRQQHLNSGFPSSANGPYVFKTPQEAGVYGMKQQQTAIGGNSSARMMMFAHDKLQETWHGADAALVSRQSTAFPFPPSSILADDAYRRKQPHHHYPAAELNGASAALEKYQQLDVPNSDAVAPSSLLELLPKKRRRAEETKTIVVYHETEVAAQEVDESETADLATVSTPRSSSRGKRNCFPKKCDFPMCKNSSRSRGFCYSHGGGRRCRVDGCSNGAVSRDLCKRHGGGRRCKVAGCKSSSESGGLCYSHGGGRRCSLAWCSARAKKGGFCALHLADQNAEQPPSSSKSGSSSRSTASSTSSAEDEAASSPTAGSTSSRPETSKDAAGAGEESVVHTNNVVETLLALARDQQTPAEQDTAPTSGYAIALILN